LRHNVNRARIGPDRNGHNLPDLNQRVRGSKPRRRTGQRVFFSAHLCDPSFIHRLWSGRVAQPPRYAPARATCSDLVSSKLARAQGDPRRSAPTNPRPQPSLPRFLGISVWSLRAPRVRRARCATAAEVVRVAQSPRCGREDHRLFTGYEQTAADQPVAA
jgi:hypothetical protein